MSTTETAGPSSQESPTQKYLTVRQAAFIGVGAMVGAGMFALLGAAGEVAGAAAAGAVFVTFVFTTLIHEPASIATLLGILLLSVALDLRWKRRHTTRPKMSSLRNRSPA